MHWTEEFFDDYYLKSTSSLTGPEQTAREVDFMLEKCQIDKQAAILDLACGLGRHSIELSNRGFLNIVGLDMNSAYLKIARTRCSDMANPPRFVQCDMREFEEKDTYLLVFSLFSSLFYFDDNHNLDLIHRIFNALKPGGIFIIDYFNPINFLNQNKTRDWYLTDDDYLILEKYSHNPISGLITNERLIISPEGRRIKRMYRLRDYTVAELRYHFEQTGFEIIDVFGDFDGNKYSLDSPRQIFVMKRPNNG